MTKEMRINNANQSEFMDILKKIFFEKYEKINRKK